MNQMRPQMGQMGQNPQQMGMTGGRPQQMGQPFDDSNFDMF
jgi:hypothetical protein